MYICVYTCISIPSLSMIVPSMWCVSSFESFIYLFEEDLMKILIEDGNAISLYLILSEINNYIYDRHSITTNGIYIVLFCCNG